jgi:hypothetical protein
MKDPHCVGNKERPTKENPPKGQETMNTRILTLNVYVGVKEGQLQYRDESTEVELMSTVGKWSMVRKNNCVPFVCETKNLKKP